VNFSSRQLHAGALALIALTGLVAYSNSFEVPLLYDDIGNIARTESLSQFDFGDWKSYSGLRSLPGATFALQRRLGADNLWQLHTVNLAIHVATAWLIYWLCLLLGRRAPLPRQILVRSFSPRQRGAPRDPAPAPLASSGTMPQGPSIRAKDHAGRRAFFSYFPPLFAALIFVAHPIATEAVTYIIQRNVSLTVFFFVLSAVSYAQWRSSGKIIGWAVLSAAAALAAVHSKQIAITLPAVIFLMELLFFARRGGRWWLYPLPFILVLIYIPWRMFGLPAGLAGLPQTQPPVALDAAGSVSDAAARAGGGEPLSRTVYFLTQAGVLLKYLRLLIFPVRQSVDHDFAVVESPYTFVVLISSLIVLGLLLVAWSTRRKSPLISLGILWFFLTLMPESTIIPLLEAIAEYRVYLPLAGFALAMGGVVQLLCTSLPRLPQRFLEHPLPPETVRLVRHSVAGVMAAVVLALTWLTWQRNFVWQNAETLWRDATVKSPGRARPHNNLGVLLLEQGRLREAVEEFEEAVRLNSGYAHAYNNLGTARAKQGDLAGAAAAYERALALDSGLAAVAVNLGTIYLQQQKFDDAAAVLEGAVAREPSSARARTVLGAVYLRQGNVAQARQQFEAALASDPTFTSARNNLRLIEEQLR
jgi:Tfp pilus assembly protein PilF